MFHLLRDIEGVEVIVDDLVVWGKDVEQHDVRLRKMLATAKRMIRTDKRSHISDLPSKPGRRYSKQGRARQSLQDHQAGVWQVQKRH